jgi:hypothetical protein
MRFGSLKYKIRLILFDYTFLIIVLNLKLQLLLMKRGGKVIYGGKLGKKSHIMVNYFQVNLAD